MRNMMETLDNHAERIGSGPYCDLALNIKTLSDSIGDHENDLKRTFAMEVVMERPCCVKAPSLHKFTNDRTFMECLVREKATRLQNYENHCASILGYAWKIEFVNALLHYDGPDSLRDVRIGVHNLFISRAGFLPQIVARLNSLGITPSMLCPFDVGNDPLEGDDGEGPAAVDDLYYEPRFLRWILEKGELEPWPVLGVGEQPEYISKLIIVANSEGGDDAKVNQPCQCNKCMGVRIPTIDEFHTSLTPSECGSDAAEEMVF